MMTDRPLHVLIAGGGLSGLCLAQGLLKDGHTCEVFERDADLSRKRGYYLHMNADGGEALRRCLPGAPGRPPACPAVPCARSCWPASAIGSGRAGPPSRMRSSPTGSAWSLTM